MGGGRRPTGRQAVVRQPAVLPERQRADEDGWGNSAAASQAGAAGNSPPGLAASAGQGPARIDVRVTTANAGDAGTPQRAAVAMATKQFEYGSRTHDGKAIVPRWRMFIRPEPASGNRATVPVLDISDKKYCWRVHRAGRRVGIATARNAGMPHAQWLA